MDGGGNGDLLFLLMDNLIIVVENIMLFLFADMFLYRRWKGAAPLLPAIIVCWGTQFLIYLYGLGQIKIIISIVMDFACTLIYYHGNRYLSALLKKSFLLVIFYVFMAVTQALSIAALYSAFGGGVGAGDLRADPALAWGTYVTSLLLNMLCLIFCERFRRVETVPLSYRNWLWLLAMPAVSIAFVWLFFPFGKRGAEEHMLMLVAGFSAVLLCFNFFIFYLYRNIARAAAVKSRYEDLQRYCKHLDSLLQSEGKRLDTIHDYLRNLGVIAALIESGRTHEAADYIYRLENRIKAIHVVKYTGNREVDAILSSKLPLMQAGGISFTVDGILPATPPFDFLDVCALLSNALDNALESCVRQGLTGEIISLRVSFLHGFFTMRLSNLMIGKQSSRARAPPIEGRGLAIMREVVEKYEGTMSISIKEDQFILSVILQEPIS